MSLHNDIMNLPASCPDDLEPTEKLHYKVGHRQARHAAAELALAVETELEQVKRERDQLQKALGSSLRIKPLAWSPDSKPTEGCRYDHTIAETQFGRFLITWKSWKPHSSVEVEETPWGGYYGSYDSVEEAKASAQAAFFIKIRLCLG